MTDINAPVNRMRTFTDVSATMCSEIRPTGATLTSALEAARRSAEVGFKPPVFGDGSDVRRWCTEVMHLDNWVTRVADVFDEVDGRTNSLTEMLLLAAIAPPDLPVVPGSGGLLDFFPVMDPDQTIAEFDEIKDDLAVSPGVMWRWIDSLSDESREELFRARWTDLLAFEELRPSHREELEEMARADLPRIKEWEKVGQKYGWAFLTIGTSLKVERLVEYDGDLFLTIEISDSVGAKLPESLVGKAIKAEVGGVTVYRLTMQFDSEEQLEETLDDIDEAFLPGSTEDLPWWGKIFAPQQTIEFSHQTEMDLARKLEGHEDLIVGESRNYGIKGDVNFLDGLLTGGGTLSTGVNRNTGNTVVSAEVRGGTDLREAIPKTVTISGGHIDVTAKRSVELGDDGEILSTTTTNVFSAQAGSVDISTPRGGVEFGTDEGTQVIHTTTTDADGRSTETLIVADTSIDRFGLSISPDPRFPTAEITYENGVAITTAVYVRDANGDWVEVSE